MAAGSLEKYVNIPIHNTCEKGGKVAAFLPAYFSIRMYYVLYVQG